MQKTWTDDSATGISGRDEREIGAHNAVNFYKRRIAAREQYSLRHRREEEALEKRKSTHMFY